MRLWWALLCSACIENKLNPPGAGNGEEDVGQLDVRPPILEFEGLPLGETSTLPLTLTNVGLGDLTIAGTQLAGTTAFTLLEEPDVVLAPDEEITVDVSFSPVNPDDEASLYVLSDDPEAPSVEVPLTGSALVGELIVVPDPLDFGAVPLGCAQEESVLLMNVGPVDLHIESIVQLGDTFGSNWDFELPLTIAAGESLEVPLSYTADDLEEDEGEVWITSDAIVGLTVADQRGSGTKESAMEDEWWQGNGPWDQTDIVFYVDQSGSMVDDQERLRANFSNFVGILEDLDLDWQIMVVTDEDGCHNEQIIDRDTDDASDVFSAAVDGPWGRWTEAGLSLVSAALENAESGGATRASSAPRPRPPR